jgi:hypothetical protein
MEARMKPLLGQLSAQIFSFYLQRQQKAEEKRNEKEKITRENKKGTHGEVL